MLRQNQAAVEAAVAAAHKATWRAADLSENWADDGFSDDLRSIVVELQRIQSDLLGGKSRRRAPTS